MAEEPEIPSAKSQPKRKKRLLWRMVKIMAILLAVLTVVVAGGLIWLQDRVAASRPAVTGRLPVAGLTAPVAVDRDAAGVPTLRGADRLDVIRALGFVHAQERFFQMDLMRRRSAGELAALVGRPALALDRRSRIHRFRQLARRVVSAADPASRARLAAYTAGVNAGLAALGEKPFEYLLLRADPEPWRDEDSVLVLASMYQMLNDDQGRLESTLDTLYTTLPKELADFLAPRGTRWDAPLTGPPLSLSPLPSPAAVNLRTRPAAGPERSADAGPLIRPAAGSNNWAVAGWRTAHGGAILADDMHLGLSVPNTWYRAVMDWPAPDGGRRHLVGVTLPGAPVLIAGSNGRLAWGFTNSYGDWTDLVVVTPDPANPDRYLTPDGPQPFSHDPEPIAVKGEAPETLDVAGTIWGPIIGHDAHGHPLALRWIAHDPAALNLRLAEMETVTSVTEAQTLAAGCGIPPQNLVCADDQGHIGWTIIGRIPRRIGFSGRLPVSWADGTHRWDGWLTPAEYPRITDPANGIIWTANARVIDGDDLARVGDGGYDLGARARQIRDGLTGLKQVKEKDLLAIQLDDRALFLAHWRELLLRTLTPATLADHPRRRRFRHLVDTTWTGRASIDSVAYRLVRAFRLNLYETVYGWLTAPCRAADPDFRFGRLPQEEGPLWSLVTERPLNLLDAGYSSWDEVLLRTVDRTIAEMTTGNRSLADDTWGRRNTTAIRHPLSGAVPFLSRWLDMPPRALPGDSYMPRVQGPSFGASERLVVSPGREQSALFEMPGGQSGHPLSPYYRTGHSAWETGAPTPLLPGRTRWELTLVPGGH